MTHTRDNLEKVANMLYGQSYSKLDYFQRKSVKRHLMYPESKV